MIAMDNNTESNERSCAKQEASTKAKKKSNLISDAGKAEKVRDVASDWTGLQLAIHTTYVVFFLRQKQSGCFLLGNITSGQYQIQ